MPESFIPVWMSLGEADSIRRALSDAHYDDGALLIADAMEDERPRSYEEMEAERDALQAKDDE